MVIAAIGPDLLNEREEAARDLQQRAAAITILDIGGVRLDKQRPAVSIDQSMTLATFDLLASIVAARPAALGGLDALTVDDGCAWRGVPSGSLAVERDQRVVDPLEQAFVTKPGKPAVDRLPRREVLGQ